MNRELAIRAFKKIQNIPYHISIGEEESFDCEGKRKILKKELEKLDYKVKERVGLFYWDKVGLPKKLLKIPHDIESSHHFLEVYIPENDDWVFVDPTWNQELVKAGFTISEWNGESSTKLAFQCFRILSSIESKKYLSKIDYKKDIKRNGEFYKAINNFCDSCLNNKEK